jgi:hypothetical protein
LLKNVSSRMTPAPQSPEGDPLFSVAQLRDYFTSLALPPAATAALCAILPPQPLRLMGSATLLEAFTRNQDPPFVFLGGVCGSSTWRDVAMARLDAAGVGYYNPQVAEWREELVAVESLMKHWCRVMLFVVDGSTRAAASMVEAAALCAEGRRLVLVVAEMEDGAVVDAEGPLGALQTRDLNRGRRYLRQVAEDHEVKVCTDAHAAVERVVQMYIDSSAEREARNVRHMNKMQS